MAINCCHGCVPPKRTPTCKFDGTCNEYSEAKKKHDALKAAYNKKMAVENGITGQLIKSTCKSIKRRRGGKSYEQ